MKVYKEICINKNIMMKNLKNLNINVGVVIFISIWYTKLFSICVVRIYMMVWVRKIILSLWEKFWRKWGIPVRKGLCMWKIWSRGSLWKCCKFSWNSLQRMKREIYALLTNYHSFSYLKTALMAISSCYNKIAV